MSSPVECESYQCINVATKDIAVSAGKYGSIILKVCESCVSKFSNQLEKNKLAVKLLGQGKDHRLIVSKYVYDEADKNLEDDSKSIQRLTNHKCTKRLEQQRYVDKIGSIIAEIFSEAQESHQHVPSGVAKNHG
jgi:hypothetical protein